VTKEEKKEYDKAYRTKNKDKYKERYTEYYKRYRDEHKAKSEAYRVQREYGLSLEQVDELVLKQNHKCAICGKLLKETKRCIDHDHRTGKVRGILCIRCNTGLWSLEDEEYKVKALEYLAKEATV